jgi:GT2 family glycosyltransferase
MGLAANRNTAISAVKQPYVLFLDDDARLDHRFLSHVAQHLKPSVIVTGWELRDGTRVTPHDPDFLGFQRIPGGITPRSIVINATVFPTALLRRIPFDESYHYGYEELDIAMSARAVGVGIVFIEAGNVHQHSSLSRDDYLRLVVRSRAHFGVQRYRYYEPSLLKLLTFAILGLINATGHGWQVSGVSGAIEGCIDFLRGLVLPIRRNERLLV